MAKFLELTYSITSEIGARENTYVTTSLRSFTWKLLRVKKEVISAAICFGDFPPAMVGPGMLKVFFTIWTNAKESHQQWRRFSCKEILLNLMINFRVSFHRMFYNRIGFHFKQHIVNLCTNISCVAKLSFFTYLYEIRASILSEHYISLHCFHNPHCTP